MIIDPKYCFILLIPVLLVDPLAAQDGVEFYKIPPQKFDVLDRLGCPKGSDTAEMPSFRISEFITYGEYKRFLEDIKKDSSKAFYKEQLPDSSMCSPEAYRKYLNSTEYDSFPVAGVPWTAAMEYCKWRTLKDNEGDSLEFIYRVPTLAEWLAAYPGSKGPPDMDRNFSDWLIGGRDPTTLPFTGYSFSQKVDEEKSVQNIYFIRKSFPPVLKQRLVIGDSFYYQLKELRHHLLEPYYAPDGYRHISFRIVKHRVEDERPSEVFEKTLYYWGLKDRDG